MATIKERYIGEAPSSRIEIQDGLTGGYLEDLTATSRLTTESEVVGREVLIETILGNLLKPVRASVMLTGASRIGRKTVIRGVARAIARGTGVAELDRLRLYLWRIEQMIEAERYVTVNRLLKVLAEEQDVVLVAPGATPYLWAMVGKCQSETWPLLFHLVRNNKIRLVAVALPEDLSDFNGWLRETWGPVMKIIEVPELGPEECREAIRGAVRRREIFYRLAIPDAAVEAAIDLSRRHIKVGVLPDKATALIDEAVTRMKLVAGRDKRDGQSLDRRRSPEAIAPVLDANRIAGAAAELTGIPVGRLVGEADARIGNLEERLGARILGQDEAIARVARIVKVARSGFKDPKRPAGVFYFVGPSGTGKTELAAALAEALFAGQESMIRIDMSEFQHPAEVNRLIGSAPGYVGYHEGGVLTEWGRKHPASVIVLDEMEKAHPLCWDIFLQLFDAGRLTDGKGATVDFRDALIIMTSNVGSDLFGKDADKGRAIGFAQVGERRADRSDEIAGRIEARLRKIFRPEFLNRIDEIVLFRPLEFERLVEIARLRLARAPVVFEPTPEALAHLARAGHDPGLGARHLRRAIRRLVIEPCTELMIAGRVKRGDRVRIECENETLRLIPA